MTIKTIQKCNRCKAKRELKATILTFELRSIAQLGGWRELNGKHLCPECVERVISDGN